MGKILSVGSLYPNTQSSRLCVTQIRTASYFKVFLLSRRPCFYIAGFHFQVCQVAGTTFQSTYRDIQRAEQINRILPQIVIPFHTLFRLTYYDHLLLLELMDPVYTAFFDSMGSFLLTEARRITGQSLRKLIFCHHRINEFPDHGMFAGSDQI